MEKTPQAVLPYEFDWSDWLETDEIITTKTITSTGVVVDSSSIGNNGRSVIVWLSGGTLNATASVTCAIATNHAPRAEARTMEFKIVNRTQ